MEPPAALKGPEGWIKPMVEELKRAPGEWRVARTFPSHRHAASYRARFKAVDPRVEAEARNGHGGVDLWVRYGETR